jgi:Family of unknown function (DUF5678)
MVATSLPASAVEAFKQYDRNLRWAKSHPDAIAGFEEKYVAIDDAKVLASGDTRESVEAAIRGRVGVYISFIPERGLIWIL